MMKHNLLALVMGTVLLGAAGAPAITVGPFGPHGEGGSKNGQSFLIGPGGSVYELDGFLYVGGLDLNGSLLGSTAQLSRDSMPTGLVYQFSFALSPDQNDLVLTYAFANSASNAFNDLRFFVLLDAEIDQSLNTFFNEYGTVQGSAGSGAGEPAPNEWQIDEPGFQTGTLFRNLFLGTLDNSNSVPQSALNDVALSLGFSLGTLQPGDSSSVRVMISQAQHLLGAFALTQHDGEPSSTTAITLSGLLGPGSNAQLVGTVFKDANANGIADSGEGLGGVTVLLQSNQVTVAQGTTDVGGKYTINSKPGTYTVLVAPGTLPAGLTLVPVAAGATNSPWPVTLAADFPRTVNWGYQSAALGALTGTVFKDSNGNGVADAGEGLAGVVLQLQSNQVTVAQSTTDSGGKYSFTNTPGNYSLKLDTTSVPAGFTLIPVQAGATNNPSSVTLPANGLSVVNWGFQPPVLGVLTGTVFQDSNTNGVVDTGEALPGVVLQLQSNQVTVAQSTTDSGGKYSFTNTPGNYSLKLDTASVPAGFTLIPVSAGTTNNPSSVTLPANGLSVVNWGFQPPVLGVLTGTVFQDSNTNGVVDTGEALAGVVLQLQSNQVTVAQTTTDTGGKYSFTNAPGNYVLRLDTNSLPAGLTLVPVSAGATNDPWSVSVPANGAVLVNWGFQRPGGAQFGDVSGLVSFGFLKWELNRARGTLVGTLGITNLPASGVSFGPPYQLGMRVTPNFFYPTNFGVAVGVLADGVSAVDLSAAMQARLGQGLLRPGQTVVLTNAVEIYSLARNPPPNALFELWATRQ